MCFFRFMLFIGMFFYLSQLTAGPLFTGPLLARSGHTIPAGHHDFEPYFFYTDNRGVFGRHWHRIHTPSNVSIQVTPLYSFGLTDWMDVQFLPPYSINNVNGSNTYHRFADTTVLMGFQLVEQHQYWPDFRLTVAEILPTGKYETLNAAQNDATGLGSYQTTIGFNFQYLYHFGGERYLRTRFVIDYNYAAGVRLQGRSTYGGFPATRGKIHLGQMESADLAFEYTWTRHWALVMEGQISHRQATRFNGFLGNPPNSPPMIGHGVVNVITIAPAFEYNWNEHIGIIAGEWLSVAGQDTVDFLSTVVAVNFFW